MDNVAENDLFTELLDFLEDDDDKTVADILSAVDEADLSDTSSSSDDSVLDQGQHASCSDFMNTIDVYSEHDFKSHFRFQRSTVEYLIEKYEASDPSLSVNPELPKVAAKKIIYMYIWYMSNSVTYRQLANLFGVTKSTAWRVVNRVVEWVISIGNEFIVWPTGSILENTCQKFLEKKKIPGVLGAIDCTHIAINAPTKEKEAYFDRKQSYSIVLQAVVDSDKKFIDVYCGESGSFHDSRVLRRSELFKKAEQMSDTIFPNGTFILGDSAYPCKNWLVPSYKDCGSLSQEERKFNYVHSSAKIIVEHAFGALKGRFRRFFKFT